MVRMKLLVVDMSVYLFDNYFLPTFFSNLLCAVLFYMFPCYHSLAPKFPI